jgi:hypothetical protein
MSGPEGKAHSEAAGKWRRFSVPEFDRHVFKKMDWSAPAFLSQDEINGLIDRQKSGDATAYGCYPVMPDEALFDRLKIQGEHRHAALCVLPDREVTILGRSFAWYIQKAWILESLEPDASGSVAEWKTPRPMNVRLGPTDGMTHGSGILYVVTGHAYGDHWIGNRTILQNGLETADGDHECRILSASLDDKNDFHDCNLSFTWEA